MADIAITAANVLAGANGVKTTSVLGATVTQGQVGYFDAASQTWKLADNDAAAAVAHAAQGIFLTAGAAGQPCIVQTKGDITAGGTLTPGTVYYLSATAGGICPVADVTSGHSVCPLGVAKSATVLAFDPQPSGVTL